MLVVDDDPTNRRMASLLLQRQGFAVHTSHDGPTALLDLDALTPDAIVLDYMMPGMNGPEVLRRMRGGSHRDVPVLLLTSSSSPEHIQEAFSAGAQDFITRPVDWRVLGARVTAAIGLAEARRQARDAALARDELLRELDEARRVQQAQLPTTPASWGLWTATGAVVASGGVGGDVFLFVVRTGRSPVVALVDVCGHGVAAAIIASQVATELRTTLIGRGPAEAMTVLNEKLVATASGKYAVLALIETHDDHVCIVNAGLPPVGQVRDGALVHSVAGGGLPPGLLPHQHYEEVELPVEAGDRLVIMSDGLTEPFGHADAIERTIVELGLLDAAPVDRETLSSRIVGILGHEQPDDATIVLLERVTNAGGWPTRRAKETFDACVPMLALVTEWVMEQLPPLDDPGMVEMGVTEAVTNAIVHGALERSSEARSNNATYFGTTRAVRGGVSLEVSSEPSRASIMLRWKGAACPIEFRQQPPEPDPLQESGRGLWVIYSVFDHVTWHEDGHGMVMTIDREEP